METHTIVSQATPMGHSSIAVVRLSGSRSFEFTESLSGVKKSRKHHDVVLLPIKNKDGEKIDSGVFTFFSKPNSYTGEEVVEISCHGNPFIVEMIIEHSIFLGARLAEPGEYTKRAFLNGKLSLSQAESVSLLISSRSRSSAVQNTKNIEGGASKKVKHIKNYLIKTLSTIEYELDVSEKDEVSKTTSVKLSKLLKNNIIDCKNLLGSFGAGTAYSTGFRVVIVGRPNVGKSTLMNAMLGLSRSIVSEQAGTTRDSISHNLIIGGVPITLVDTAGVRETQNKIEIKGVKRTKAEIDRGDIVISLFTGDIQPIENIELKNKINVFTKTDIHNHKNVDTSAVFVSAVTGLGLNALKKSIKKNIMGLTSYTGDTFINTERQRLAIHSCLESTTSALSAITKKPPLFEIAAHESRLAINSLESFLGETTTDEILDSVFSDFCVGK
jgi:tRNA modification GTPase